MLFGPLLHSNHTFKSHYQDMLMFCGVGQAAGRMRFLFIPWEMTLLFHRMSLYNGVKLLLIPSKWEIHSLCSKRVELYLDQNSKM